MNKLKLVVFLLLTLFSFDNFAKECSTEDSNTQQSRTSCILDPYLSVTDIRNEGLLIVLNDGSEWNVRYFGGAWRLLGWGWIEQQNISHWSVGDAIEIQYPKTGNLTDFILLIVNVTKGEEAYVFLKQAPSIDHSACFWVLDFDTKTNYITLNNGMAWFRTNLDMYGAFLQHNLELPMKWEPGDPITLLRVEGWFNRNDFLLWNHSTNEMPYVLPMLM
jgi:hypothetical protein